MNETDLYLGQHVMVRSWENMKDEFGEDQDGDIDLGMYYFFASMRNLCGKDFIVEEFDPYDGEIIEPCFEDLNGQEVCVFSVMLEEYNDMAINTAVDTGDLL